MPTLFFKSMLVHVIIPQVGVIKQTAPCRAIECLVECSNQKLPYRKPRLLILGGPSTTSAILSNLYYYTKEYLYVAEGNPRDRGHELRKSERVNSSLIRIEHVREKISFDPIQEKRARMS